MGDRGLGYRPLVFVFAQLRCPSLGLRTGACLDLGRVPGISEDFSTASVIAPIGRAWTTHLELLKIFIDHRREIHHLPSLPPVPVAFHR